MRALVIGASGLVGGALVRAFGADAMGTYRSRPVPGLRPLDARDRAALRRLIVEIGPALVLFPAAEADVDWCEAHPEEARAANVEPARSALDLTREAGARLVFFSSDYVFDGRSGPYDEAATTSPISVYGRHKREVEERVLDAGGTVVRTTSVFGAEPPPGKNFVLRLVARLRAGERVRVPADQVSTPTWSDDLAQGVLAVAAFGGIWHVAGPELLARDAFARVVADVFGLDASLIDAVATAALGQPASRPLRGGLRTDKLRLRIGRPLLGVGPSLERLRGQLAGPRGSDARGA